MLYAGRPGISPALAALIASGSVRPNYQILDVGCGTGTDAILLAKWGFKHVVGVDPDASAIVTARQRATRARLGKRVTFHPMGAEGLSTLFATNTFDVVLHTLVANNLTKQKAKHFRELAAVMKRDGLLVLQERVGKRLENAKPNKFPPLAAVRKRFTLTDGIATQLAEHHTGRRGPAYARVFLWLGRPR